MNSIAASKSMYEEKEKILALISDSIRNSLDIDEILKIICKEVSILLNVQRTSIWKFDAIMCSKSFIYIEHIVSDLYKGADSLPDKRAINEYWTEILLKRNEPVLIENLPNSSLPEYVKNSYRLIGVKSFFCMPLRIGAEIWGGIFLSEYEYFRKWTEEEISLVISISNQLNIAAKQAELYSTVKKQAEREQLLRRITDIIRSSLNIEEIKSNIVCEIGKALGADRCILRIYDIENDKFLPVENNCEYISTEDIHSIVDICNESGWTDYLNHYHKNNCDFINMDIPASISSNDKEANEYFKKAKLKSGIRLPIFYSGQLMGLLILNYVKEKIFLSCEELDFIKVLANQTGIALYQAHLYQKEKQKAENEELLRKIIGKIKNCSDGKNILNSICKDIAHFFDVERVFVQNFENNFETHSNLAEYKVDNNFTGINETDIKTREMLYKHWTDKFKQSSDAIVIDNIFEYTDSESVRSYYLKINLKSLIIISLKYGDNKWGCLSLSTYTRFKKWTENEINLLENISQHLTLLIKEASLYNQAQFLANVSHEIRTPLTTISGYSELLLDKSYNPSEAVKYLKIINENVARINCIIQNLLFISKIEVNSRKGKIALEECKLIDILDGAAEISENEIKSKKSHLIIECCDYIEIKANFLLLQQAVVNLISNAVKYSDINSKVLLSGCEKDGEIILQVRDWGYGIEQCQLDYIFERFYRIDKSRNRQTGGAGLGLSIVKLVAEAHKGYVSVNSKLNHGSVFSIHLPSV